MPPMLQPRASPAVATVNGKIYVFGGDQINEVDSFIFYKISWGTSHGILTE